MGRTFADEGVAAIVEALDAVLCGYCHGREDGSDGVDGAAHLGWSCVA